MPLYKLSEDEKSERRKASCRKWRSSHIESERMRCEKYRAEHREEINRKSRERRHANPELHRESQGRSRLKHPESQGISSAKWKAKNPDYFPNYYKKHKKEYIERKRKSDPIRLANDPVFKMIQTLRGRLKAALSRAKAGKIAHTLDLLGCSVDYFMKFIERQFLPGMAWKNHGVRGWHVDHRQPIVTFNLNDPEQQRWAFHYSNLQPLWAKDNLKKQRKHFPLPVAARAGRGLTLARV